MSGLQSGENRRRADAYLSRGYGGLVGFELKGGVDAGRLFIDSLKLLYHVANIGDARSLAIHPAPSTTDARRAVRGRRHAWLRAPVGRPRTSRGHSRSTSAASAVISVSRGRSFPFSKASI